MRRATFLALLLLAAGCLTARGTPEEPVIVALELRGVKAVDAEELAGKLATQASGSFFWSDARRLDPDALSADRRRVTAFYRERGYYQAAVESVEILPAGPGRARLVLHVVEGKPVHVTRVTVEGLDAAPEARDRVGALAVRVDRVFTEAAFDAARLQLEAALAQTGYATGKVTQAAQVLPEQGTAEVTYRVEAGPRFRFGPIVVTGTDAVPRGKVEARAASEVTRGQWFDERQLEKVRTRVFGFGVFSGVRVGHGEPDLPGGELPVAVAVREAPFHTLRFGPGIGFQAARWETQGQASWVHRNWLGGLRRLQLDARAGYAWIPDPYTRRREGVVAKLATEFSQPGILGDAVDFSTRVELEKGLEQAYAFYAERFRIGTPIRLSTRWTVAPTYNFEVYQLSELVGTPGAPGETLPQLRNCPSKTCLLSYLEQRVVWDGRNDPLDTTQGLYVSLAVQEGFDLNGYGYRFLRFLPEARVFLSLLPGTVLATRVRAGALVPIGEKGPAPVVALFSVGGALSMRGYGAGRLSPMSPQGGTWIPTGGNGLLEGSVELRQKLGGSLAGALFLDAGNVSEASDSPAEYRSALDPSKLQLALGLGLRYHTMFGPLRVDVAGRVPTRWSGPFSSRFPAVPGTSGHHEPIAAVHLTLGEAF